MYIAIFVYEDRFSNRVADLNRILLNVFQKTVLSRPELRVPSGVLMLNYYVQKSPGYWAIEPQKAYVRSNYFCVSIANETGFYFTSLTPTVGSSPPQILFDHLREQSSLGLSCVDQLHVISLPKEALDAGILGTQLPSAFGGDISKILCHFSSGKSFESGSLILLTLGIKSWEYERHVHDEKVLQRCTYVAEILKTVTGFSSPVQFKRGAVKFDTAVYIFELAKKFILTGKKEYENELKKAVKKTCTF